MIRLFHDDGKVSRVIMMCIEWYFPNEERQSHIIGQLQDYRAPTKLFAYVSATCERKNILLGTLDLFCLFYYILLYFLLSSVLTLDS